MSWVWLRFAMPNTTLNGFKDSVRGPMVSGLDGVVSVLRVCWNGRPPVSGLPLRLAIFRRWIVSFGYTVSIVLGLG